MASITTEPAFADLTPGSTTATRQVSRYVTSEEVENPLSTIEAGVRTVFVTLLELVRCCATSLKKLSGVDVVYFRTGLRPSILFFG